MISELPPLEKVGALCLNKLGLSLSKAALCQVWLKMVCGFGEDENMTDGRGQSGNQKSSLELSTQVS